MRRALFIAGIILFLDAFGYALLFPVLFINQTVPLLAPSVTPKIAEILLTVMLIAYPLAQCFGAPLFGQLSDIYGRKRILVWTICGTILADAASALSIHFSSYSALLISQLLSGFFAGNLVLCLAIMADVCPTKRKRGWAFTIVAAILGLAWMDSLLLLFLLSHPASAIHPAIPFWCWMGLSIISLIILTIWFQETLPAPPEEKPRHLIRFNHLRTLIMSVFFWAFGLFTAAQWIVPILTEQFHIERDAMYAYLFAIGIGWVVGSLAINGYFIKNFSLWKTALWGLSVMGLLLFFSAVTEFLFYFELAFLLAMIAASIIWGNLVTVTSLAAQEYRQGQALGMVQSMFSLSKVLAPVIGGWLASYSMEPLLYTCAGSVLIAFLILLTNLLRRADRQLVSEV